MQHTIPPGDSRLVSVRQLVYLFFLPVLMVQIVVLIFLVIWEQKRSEEEQVNGLTEVARGFYEQIIVTRTWNAQHGGVYAEITPETQPNPYLNVPDRDIVSVSGKRYTKINPAYMTRQLSEIAERSRGYRFRIVGLRPVNPVNAPDRWEKMMLQSFEKGGPEEATAIDKAPDGSRLFKYFVPLKTEKSCLQCHAEHGSVLGDIRGGISIILPMTRSDMLSASKLKRTIISLIVLSAVSMVLTAVITLHLSKRLNREIDANIEKEKLDAVLELAGAAAHEMRQPMTVMYSVIGIMEEKVSNNEPLNQDEMQMIITQCKKMNDTIKKMLSITQYRTREYLPGKNIVDFDASVKGRDTDIDGKV